VALGQQLGLPDCLLPFIMELLASAVEFHLFALLLEFPLLHLCQIVHLGFPLTQIVLLGPLPTIIIVLQQQYNKMKN